MIGKKIYISTIAVIIIIFAVGIQSQESVIEANPIKDAVFIDSPTLNIISVNFNFVAITPAIIRLHRGDLITMEDIITNSCFHYLYSDEKNIFVKLQEKYYLVNNIPYGLKFFSQKDIKNKDSRYDRICYLEMKTPLQEEIINRLATLFPSLVIVKTNGYNKNLKFLSRIANLKVLDFSNSWINDSEFSHLKYISDLHIIRLNFNISDTGLTYLKNCFNISVIDLNRPSLPLRNIGVQDRITEGGLLSLKNMQRLRIINLQHAYNIKTLLFLKELRDLNGLYLRKTPINDIGIQYIKHLSNLSIIDLGYTYITDKGLICLQNHPNLRTIDLTNTKITNKGLVYLREIPNLFELILEMTSISDVGLLYLENLQNLSVLNLNGTRITDIGITYLMKFRNLRHLDLKATKITNLGVKMLKKNLPQCKITVGVYIK